MTQLSAPPRHEGHASPPGRRASWFAVLLIVALAITLAGVFPFRQIIAQERQVSDTQAKLDALIAENERLEEEVGLLQTPAEIERLAREDLGLVRPGETGYTVEEVTPDRAAPLEVERDGRSLFERIWDFLTGRDLVKDG